MDYPKFNAEVSTLSLMKDSKLAMKISSGVCYDLLRLEEMQELQGLDNTKNPLFAYFSAFLNWI